MKSFSRFVLAGCLSASLGLALPAQTTKPGAVLDEPTRLMQEYMAKRAEWIAVRVRARQAVKELKDAKARNDALVRYQNEELALRAATAELAARLKAATEAKQALAAQAQAPRT